MKVTFEFDSDKESFDYQELQRYYQVDDMAMCISDILDKCRSWYKYDERSEIPIEEVYDTIIDIVNNYCNMEKMGY